MCDRCSLGNSLGTFYIKEKLHGLLSKDFSGIAINAEEILLRGQELSMLTHKSIDNFSSILLSNLFVKIEEKIRLIRHCFI